MSLWSLETDKIFILLHFPNIFSAAKSASDRFIDECVKITSYCTKTIGLKKVFISGAGLVALSSIGSVTINVIYVFHKHANAY